MSKALRTAAIVVGAVALAATGVGLAIGAGAAIAGTVTVGTIASAASLGATGLALGASLTAKRPGFTATGSPDQFTANPDAPVPIIFGRFATAGNIIFRRAWDTSDKGDNDRQSFVVALSLGPIQSIESFWVDKAQVGFNVDGSGQATGTYAGFMWQKTQLGACPEAAAIGFGTGAGTPPTPPGKLSGIAAASWTLKFDTKGKLYQNGVPSPRWVIKGAKVYDPRLDSTYPGGSGSQRVNDQSTWAYSDNPYLCALAWCLGFYQNGQRVMGIGAPAAQIDIAAFVEGANIADLNSWQLCGAAYSTDNKWDTLKSMLQAGMAEPLQLGAMISCFTNAPKVSLATITVDDVVGNASVTATQPRRDRINGVSPRYWQEANDWQYLSGTAVRVTDYETADNGQRTKEIDYPFIPSGGSDVKQIATACRYDIENAREFGPIVLPLKLRWIGYRPGDCVTANLPELGLDNQTILLLNRDFDPSAGIPTFTARSETNAKHAFALGQTSTPPPTPGVSAAPLVPVPGSTAWTIAATSVSSSGQPVPALVIVGAVDSPVAEQIVVEYRLYVSGQAADAGWIAGGSFTPDTTNLIITSVQPGTAYEVAISYRRRGAVGDRTIYGPATTSSTALDASLRPAPNLLVNGDFKDGLNGWTVGVGAWVPRTYPTVGTYIAHDPATGVTNDFIYQKVGVVAGLDYSVSFESHLYGTSPNAFVRLQFVDASEADVGAPIDVNGPFEWGQRYASGLVTAPTGATGLRVYLAVENATTSFEATRVMIQPGPATAWRDDSSPGLIPDGTIVADKLKPDEGVDLTVIVDGTIGSRWGPVTPLTVQLVNSTDGGSVSSGILSFGSMNISTFHRLRFVASVSGYVTTPDFTNALNYSLALYIRINGGSWVSTGLSASGSNLGNTPNSVSVDQEMQSAWNGAAELGVAVSCSGKAGAVLSGSASSISRLEIASWK